jgi:hypothetical protein
MNTCGVRALESGECVRVDDIAGCALVVRAARNRILRTRRTVEQ